MLSKQKYYDIIDYIIEISPGFDTRVLIMAQAEGLTRYANSMIHQNVFEDLTTVSITVIDGEKKSEQSTTDYSEQGLKKAVTEAINNLEFLPSSGTQPLPVTEPALIEHDSFNKELEKSFGVKQRALELKTALNTLPEEYLAYGTYSYTEYNISYGSSQGVKRFARSNSVKFSILISDKTGGTSFITESAQEPQNIDFIKSFAQVFERAKLNNNQQQIEPGAYTVILEPAAVSDIVLYLAFAGFSAKSVQNKISFLTDKLNQQVFDKRITIEDDWQNPNTLAIPFDFEGYPRQRLELVTNGWAKQLAYDTLSAMKDNVPTTGHSINDVNSGGIPINLVMSGGEKPLDKLIAESDDAILVTRFHYMNIVNPRTAQLTGLTRDGLFQIKNGKIVAALHNMRFTQSIVEAFNNVVDISSDRKGVPKFLGNVYMPSMVIKDFHFTGKTN